MSYLCNKVVPFLQENCTDINSWLLYVACFLLYISGACLFQKICFKCYTVYREHCFLDNLLALLQLNRNEEVIQILEMYPYFANVVVGRSGYTPFLLACKSGNYEVVHYMLNQGIANIKSRTNMNENAIYLVTLFYVWNPQNLNAFCIKDLYYAGVSINEPTQKGLTALHLAVMFGNTSLVKWLINKGASPNIPPKAYSLALSYGHDDTADVIRKMEKKQLDFNQFY